VPQLVLPQALALLSDRVALLAQARVRVPALSVPVP
jgi:hypothetical protein